MRQEGPNMAKANKVETARSHSAGAVHKEIARLLTGLKSPLAYAAIAERVRKRVPGARTTDRSVASVASQLRAEGVKLPDRRRAA
jgi:hypothetical protein